ncbi:MAG: tRNA pseudouridine(55) synthase TruB [Rhodospirillaceae bacterium]|nr:tRNA pseudouridine(55) synthase TruB [Rhodospirillaceae bacterium]
MARKKKGNPVHGWVVIDKPLGLSSSQTVGKVRKLFDAQKAGHGGTLDPLATGVLPIALGEATKTVSFVMDGAKTYQFTVRWGQATTTDDAEGDVVETSDKRPDAAQIEAALPRLTGLIEQVPPVYSAIKIDGQRAYKLARDGEDVQMKSRPAQIDEFRLLGTPDPDHARFEVICQKGTYIRALGRDLAILLGTVGHVSALRRTRTGPFGENDAISLDSLEALGHIARLETGLLPIRTALDDIPALALTETEAGLMRQGGFVALLPVMHRHADLKVQQGETVLALAADKPVALARITGAELRPVRVLNL